MRTTTIIALATGLALGGCATDKPAEPASSGLLPPTEFVNLLVYGNTTAPTPEPQAGVQAKYASGEELIQDLQAKKFMRAVRLDGRLVHPGAGPALKYFTEPDKSVVMRN